MIDRPQHLVQVGGPVGVERVRALAVFGLGVDATVGELADAHRRLVRVYDPELVRGHSRGDAARFAARAGD